MKCKPRLTGEERAQADLTARLIEQNLAGPAYALADAVEHAETADVRPMLDAIAVYQGHDLVDLYDGDVDPDYEAQVLALVEAAESGREDF